MSDITPIFYDHTSVKSLLTPWLPEETKPNGPQSFLKIAKDLGLKQVYFVSTNFYSFIEAWKNANKLDIQLIFGLELWICNNAKERSDQSTLDESKIIVWIKNGEGYKDLIKIFSKIYTDPTNKYYHIRGSWSDLKDNWTDNLTISVPFFDSFLHRNVMNFGSKIIPDFPIQPYFHREIDSGLPFERIINKAIDRYNPGEEYIFKTKTIFYEKKEDVDALMNSRATHNHAEFESPELPFFCSDNFSVEDYRELTK